MSLVSVTEAAVLVGKSNPTIYRHIKSGKLSRDSGGLIDTSELIRVYGELKTHIDSNSSQKRESLLPRESTETENEKWLKAQFEKLQKDIKELKDESLARENRLMALLEHKKESRSGSLFDKIFK